MIEHPKFPGFLRQISNRLIVAKARLARSGATFVRPPEPRTIGDFRRGEALSVGRLQLSGFAKELDAQTPWKIADLSPLVLAHLHGFLWLDDLAAFGTVSARQVAQSWNLDWIARFGAGNGDGWAANLTGQRLIRLVNHAGFIQSGLSEDDAMLFMRSLAIQTLFLAKTAHTAESGLPRIEALSGLICASLALENMTVNVAAALAALHTQCDEHIDDAGGLDTRNPEELLEVFSQLIWVQQALEIAAHAVPDFLTLVIGRIAPVLRSLRHGDGSLARFHGGGQGIEYRLDQTLGASGVRAAPPQDQAMGYARISSGGTTLIADADAPPDGAASGGAHASTSAFELTTGRQRLIVNCGSGVGFGAEWRQAGRATPSHSTVGLDGVSSSRFGPMGQVQLLADRADQVVLQKTTAIDGLRLQLSHNGYQNSHGLVHARTLDLTLDGKGVVGEDELYAPDATDVDLFHNHLQTIADGLSFSVRFHLHPDVTAQLDQTGNLISLRLPLGETWVFRHDGSSVLKLEPSVYLEQGFEHPKPTLQIVLHSVAQEITTRVKWSLAKSP